MSDSPPIDPILERFLENRDNLSDAEFSHLIETLRMQPHLAERLKDHLMMDELLAQQYVMDRKDFIGQFEERLQSEFPQASEQHPPQADESGAETYALRWSNQPKANGSTLHQGANRTSPPAAEPKVATQPVGEKHEHPWVSFFGVLLGLILFAAGLLGLEYTPAARQIAVLDDVTGMAFVYRDEVGIIAAPGMLILPGDEIQVQKEARVSLHYRDHSRINLAADTTAVFQPGRANLPGLLTADQAKEVFLETGKIEAVIRPQPPGRAMLLKTSQVQAKVLGTRLIVAIDQEQSRVEVIEGMVEVQSELLTNELPQEISAGQQVLASQTDFRVSPGFWPTETQGLVFLLAPSAVVSQNPNQGVQVLANGPDKSTTILRPRRKARFDEGRLLFQGGAFLAENSLGNELLKRCQESNELTLELLFQTAELAQTGPARLVSFSTSSQAGNFSLAQEDNLLLLRLLTQTKTGGEMRNDITLFTIPDTSPHHVVVTYSPGKLQCYLDGKPMPLDQKIIGTLAAWKSQHLLFGDEWTGEREWQGSLTGLAISNRAISADEAARNALHFRLRFPGLLLESNPVE